jgi:uncharacterized protein (DUF427 family)
MMTDKAIKIPGPDHPITVEAHPGRVVVTLDGVVLADSRRTLALREAKYPPVFYIPRADADMSKLQRTAHATYCPYKGDCSYFSLPSGPRAANGVWSYEYPYPSVAAIKDHLAFYPDRVDISQQP